MYLKERYGQLRYVQFVDGDCMLQAGWMEAAVALLEQHTDWAAVCGRLREREPGASIYNRLCDLEWDRPVGRTEHCGGIFMARVTAFEAVGGFDATLGAGEEPELCRRLHRAGWQTHRVDTPMALHDADMVVRHGEKVALIVVTHSATLAERIGRVMELRNGLLFDRASR